MAKKQVLTGTALKNKLWETLQGVQNKTVTTDAANSIALQSREITRIVGLELKAYKMMNKKPTAQTLAQLR